MATITQTKTATEARLSTQPKLPAPSETKLPKIQKIPTFTDKYEQRKWEKSQMAAAFRIFAKLGFADGVAGHMSLRDPVHPDLFWINPYAKHFSQINVSDLVLVDEHGEIQEPTKYTVSKAGFIIHSVLHQMRPDINVAVHLHSPYGRAWSAFGRPIEMLVQDSCYFYDDLSVYEGFGGTVLAKEEGMNLARALGPKNRNIILQNHGIMSCGATVGEAAGFFIALERACHTQLLIEAAAAGGVPKKYIPREEAEYSKRYDYTQENTYMSFQPEYQCMLAETNGSFLQ
ncbi:putative aldolase [Hypoxylon rubiginosum]|uniref:Aldolase n=1 Tax=Hypoxylon rubiginosum TaxID=110542 RepID=A0ACC0CLR8_9PEZI|nr:putative aldolase [Hypoxylon rubiginosum]